MNTANNNTTPQNPAQTQVAPFSELHVVVNVDKGDPNLAIAHIRELLDRARRNDATVLPELAKVLDKTPDIWQHMGDLAALAEIEILGVVNGGNLLGRECAKRKLASMKIALAGPSCSLIEKLLIDRIGLCWLQVHHLELLSMSAAFAHGSESVYVQRRLDSANRRYLLALRQLATVRKLLSLGTANAKSGARKRPTGKRASAASTSTERGEQTV